MDRAVSHAGLMTAEGTGQRRGVQLDRPLAWHLTLLCLGLAVPILILAAILGWSSANSEARQIEQEALRLAHDVAATSDRELAGLIATTEVLSLSRLLQVNDLDGFDGQARDVYHRLGVNVVLRDPAGHQLVNARLPRGASLPPRVEESDRTVLETKKAVISDLFTSSVTRKPLFIVNFPVLQGEQITYFLSLSVEPERIRNLIQAMDLPAEWRVAVVDRRGGVIADSGHHGTAIGQRLPQTLWEELKGDDGILGERVVDPAEGKFLVTFSRSDVSEWIAMVMVPSAVAEAPLLHSLANLAILAVWILVCAAVLAVVFSRRIERSVGSLTTEAVRLGEGEVIRPLTTPVREINRLGAVLSEAAAKRRSAEAALRGAEEHLRELQSQMLHVSRLSAMGQMAAAMAHELNQPLGAAANFLNAALIILGAGGSEGQERAIAHIKKATDQTLRAGAILRRLRDFVSRGEVDKRIVNARELVEDAVALALVGTRDAELRVRLDCDLKNLPVLVDTIQIQQVIFNLIKNALEATSGRNPREVIVTTKAADGGVEISVADSGRGLPSNLETLFEPFTSSKPHGLGIGLSICRTIIEAHGGRLWARPREGGGAVFLFTVPAV